jgi:hypothetical protein
MANLTPTNLLAGLSVLTEKYQGAEWRMPDTAALSTAYTAQKANPDLQSLRTREDRTVNYDFPIRKSSSSGTARAALHTGSRTDSLRTALSWQSYTETFSISEKQLDNNTISYENAFAKGVQSCVFNLLKRFDDWFIAQLIADKTQINVGGVRGTWDSTNYNMKLDADQQDYWKEQIEANMGNNEYGTELTIIADSLSFIDMVRSLNQGQMNATNLSYQFGSGEIIKTTKTLLSGFNGSAIAFPSELVGLVPWIPKQNRKPLDPEKAMTVNGDFGSITVPVVNDKGQVIYSLDFAISMYTTRSDTSASNGNAQDLLSQIEVSHDFAYFSAPLSTFRSTGSFAGKTDGIVYSYGLNNVQAIN